MSSVYDSPEFAAHMEAIRANLACDIPRLVLADRLEEWGEVKWANFIRKQIHKPDNRGWISDYVFTHESHDWVNLNLRDFVGSEAASVVQPGNQYSSYLKYARGFLVEIRCTLADWLGGVCPTCGGTGALAEEIYDGATPIGVSGFGCESCGGVKGSNQISDWGNPQVGTGKTPAHGPAIARMGALELVTFTDLIPWHDGSDDTYCWWRSTFWDRTGLAEQHRNDEGNIPDELFEIMKNNHRSKTQGIGQGQHIVFDSSTAANNALSQTAIQWALSESAKVMA